MPGKSPEEIAEDMMNDSDETIEALDETSSSLTEGTEIYDDDDSYDDDDGVAELDFDDGGNDDYF